jgi:fructose-bisphosphate aldolase, class I
MAYNVVQASAAGITFGRNIWQSTNLLDLIRALKHILHENGSVDEALGFLENSMLGEIPRL